MIFRINCFIYVLLSGIFLPVYANSHHPQQFLQSIKGSKDEGKQIYQHFCANCHAENPKILLGAPKIGYEPDWDLRLHQGIKVLLKHTSEGINYMPARGGCFECSDEQLILSILVMLSEKDKKILLNQLKVHKKNIE